MILGLIPARGGSKGIKNKNIRLFCGNPLLVYSIEVGLQCDFIDKLCVSSDSKKIMRIALEHGAEIIPRPKELAQDDTPMMPVIQHTVTELDEWGDWIDTVVLLDPTSPLRTVEDIKGAYRLFKKGDCDLVASGCVAKHHPSFNMVVPDHNYVRKMHNEYRRINFRQECNLAYDLNTNVWIYSREVIKCGNRMPFRTKLYLVPEERSCHIDTELDWEIAEYLYGRNK